MSGPAQVEAYIAAADPRFRAALNDIRAAISDHLTLREVTFEECISYAMPGMKVLAPKPAMVAGYAAFARKCGFYPHSGSVIPGLAALIGARGHTKSALHFTPDDPIPADLLAAALDARLAEIG